MEEIRERGRVGEERAGVEGGWGEERGRNSDMERDECDPHDNSPMLAGLPVAVATTHFPSR